MSNIRIRKVRAILTAPAGINLIVVKVETNEPELYGLGCATFAYRELAVKCMVEDYLDPLRQYELVFISCHRSSMSAGSRPTSSGSR